MYRRLVLFFVGDLADFPGLCQAVNRFRAEDVQNITICFEAGYPN